VTGGSGRVLPRALRAAAPLLAGHGVVLVTGFGLQVALVAWAFRPEEMAPYGLLSQALQWIVVGTLLGIPTALLRHVPARPEEARDLLATARATVLATTVATAAALTLLPPVRRALLGDDDAARVFEVYAWRAVPLAQIVVTTHWLHARGRLGAKAATEASERVLILGLALAGALVAGLAGFGWGSVAATTLGAAVAWKLAGGDGVRGRPRAALVRPLLRVGAPQLLLALLETVRPLLVLRLATQTIGDLETGLLATGIAFSLPLIALPDLAAQALFPGMHGPDGERGHVRGEARTVLREVLVAGALFLLLYGAAAAWLLPTLRGGRYAGAVAPLVALLPGVLAHGLSSHAGYLLLVRDRLGAAALASAVSVAVAGVVAWALLPTWGAAGGALALSAAALVRTSIILLVARR
jgi:O-antigen/teichoic acid export membrane protein